MNIKDPIQNKKLRIFVKKVEEFVHFKRKEIQEQNTKPDFNSIHNQYIKNIVQFLIQNKLPELDFKEYDQKIEERTAISYLKDPIKYTEVIINNDAFAENFYCDIIASISLLIDEIEYQSYSFYSRALNEKLKLIKSFQVQKLTRPPTQIKLSKYNFKRR